MTSTAESLLNDLIARFDPNAAQGLNAEIQFLFHGTDSAAYYLRIANGKCTLHQGELDFARLTIRVDVEVWRAIQQGEIAWAEAMMQRKFTATGNFPLLARLPQLFRLVA